MKKRTKSAAFPVMPAVDAGGAAAAAGFMITVSAGGAFSINLSRRSRSSTLESWGAEDAKAGEVLVPCCVALGFSISMMMVVTLCCWGTP